MLRLRTASHRADGFTLMEIVIALAVIALLGAVIVTAAVSRVRDSRAASLAQTMNALSDAILGYRADVRRYPTHLSYLTTSPPVGAKDLCAQTVPASYRSAWRGPYLKSAIANTGLVIEESTVRDSLGLDPAGPFGVATTGAIVIVTFNVDSTAAAELESRFDGNANFSAGTIRFAPTGSGQGILGFAVPVRGC